MSYIPTNWQTGDVITSEKLNKIEGGVVAAQTPDITIDDNDKLLTSKAEMVLAGETELFPETELSAETFTFMSGADISSFTTSNAIRIKIGGTDYFGLLPITDLSEIGAPIIGVVYQKSSVVVQIVLPDETVFTDPQYAEIAGFFQNGRGLYVMGAITAFGSNIMSATIGTPGLRISKEWALPSLLEGVKYFRATPGQITNDYSFTPSQYTEMQEALTRRHPENRNNYYTDAVIVSIGTKTGIAYAQNNLNDDNGKPYVAVAIVKGFGTDTDHVTSAKIGVEYIGSDGSVKHGAMLNLYRGAVHVLYGGSKISSSDLSSLSQYVDSSDAEYTIYAVRQPISGHSGYRRIYYFIAPIFASGNTISAYRFASGADMIDVDATTGAITEVTT